MSNVQKRYAVRALILTETSEVLLLRMKHPEHSADFWLLPGGGVKLNESPLVALRREVLEETGLNLLDSPTLIWKRTHRFERGLNCTRNGVDQYEEIYLVNRKRFEPTAANNPDLSKVGDFQEFRWWSATDLTNAKGELFAPRSLPILVQRLVEEGPPSHAVALSD